MNKCCSCLSLFLCLVFNLTGQTDTILIDFGNELSPLPWNNITNPHSGNSNNLINANGFETSIDITVIDSFNYINNSGTEMSDPGLNLPATATRDNFYGNTELFQNQLQPTAGIELSDLDISKAYSLTIFASRIATDNRETAYEIIGNTSDVLYLDVSSNTDMVVNHTLFPAADGTIKIIATAGPNNDNSNGFFYLGSMKVHYPEEPTGTANLNLLTPNGGEYWQVGKTGKIKWESENLGLIDLDYSIDNGAIWQNITNVLAIEKEYDWIIPDMPSTECLIRIYSDNIEDQGDNNFEITTDSSRCTIVVLGSSTAAGTGPTSSDSTWVNRFRNELTLSDTRHEVVNLAQGGYTTFHILPDDATIPSGINISVDSNRNVSRALSYDPYAIIVNMPSNDAALNFGVEQQLSNFETIYNEANSAGVEVYICTTQPRNFGANQVQIQEAVRDSILSIYGENGVDFWNGFADANGYILPAFDSGDGVHMNNNGHRILFERISNKQIDTICLPPITINVEEQLQDQNSLISIYPNPFQENVFLEIETDVSGLLEVVLIDLLGRELAFLSEPIATAGRHSIHWMLNELDNNNQLFFAKARFISPKNETRIVLPLMKMSIENK